MNAIEFLKGKCVTNRSKVNNNAHAFNCPKIISPHKMTHTIKKYSMSHSMEIVSKRIFEKNLFWFDFERDHKILSNLPSTLRRFAFWLAISRSVGESIPETLSRFWGNIFILSNCFFSNSVSSVVTLWWRPVTKYPLDGAREHVGRFFRNFEKSGD